jgi:TIR domain-containing protein
MSDAADRSQETYFLSYSRSDERFALRLAKDLRAHGVAMWVDQLDIRPSQHWDRAIERAVSACRGLVVILSPRSVASDNVADEISFAIDSGKTVLPVMIEKCVLPLRITRMHIIDATGVYDKALSQCLAELRRLSGASEDQAAAPMAAALDTEIVSDAKLQLASILGPIADILVDKAADRADSVADFYGQLALHIDDEKARERFLATGSHGPSDPATKAAPNATAISTADVDAIANALTSYLGPIAPILAQRESRVCATADELRQRLAARIPTERDRSAFIRQATAR